MQLITIYIFDGVDDEVIKKKLEAFLVENDLYVYGIWFDSDIIKPEDTE